MEWNEYLSELLKHSCNLDGITMSFAGSDIFDIPLIVKASILMLDKMNDSQGKRHIMVLPERSDFFYMLSVCSFLHEILSGKNTKEYDPSTFKVGEKLKVGSAVVEFAGTDYRDGHKCVIIKTSEGMKSNIYADALPVLQKTTTRRQLSPYTKFVKARKEIAAQRSGKSTEEKKAAFLSENKTQISKSFCCVSSVVSIKEKIVDSTLCGKKVTELLLLASADFEGNVQNIGIGQLAGTPAIIYTSDLYAVLETIHRQNPVNGILIDFSSINVFLSQLDALDELLSLNVPIIIITDTMNSFDFEEITKRNFDVWRWDEKTIIELLYSNVKCRSNIKVRNCARQNMKYLKVDGHEISMATKELFAYRNQIQELSPAIMKAFGKMFSLTFDVLQTTIPINEINCELAQRTLDVCKKTIESEIHYLSNELFQGLSDAIDNLYAVYKYNYRLLKNQAVKDFLLNNDGKKICLVIPERSSKKNIQDYWDEITRITSTRNIVVALHPSEYYLDTGRNFDITIVSGWFRRAIMRKIIYSYNTTQYIVLLYDYEVRWKNHDSKNWERELIKSDNKTTMKKSFSEDVSISYEQYIEASDDTDTPSDDEMEEIEIVLKENRFRQYTSTGRGNETVEAIPVNFVGDYIAFYRTGHKLISATQIVTGESEKIKTVLPSELQVGDFIVVREADKDLIKDMAYILLENEKKSHLRELATKWKEVLNIELLFCTKEKLYEKITAAGCTKGYPTFKNWIEDEDMICPQQKQDLQYIADAANSDVLSEMIDDIFEASQEVKSAHVQAGRVLSQHLKRTIADELLGYGEIDPFNFWVPMELEVDGVGTIMILKIIDIGNAVSVDSSDTNRLIGE